MDDCRLLVDPPAAGAWNMAADDVLLEFTGESGRICLRWYAWSAATLSLGYFQACDERLGHAASLPCPVVRRSSGGGAIVHDRELTYSLAVPSASRWSSQVEALYGAVHRTLMGVLADFGVQCTLCERPSGRATKSAGGKQAPFLCFQRRATGDVIVPRRDESGDVKIAGSAQRRSRRAVLQHGSVLLARSDSAPELAGLSSFVRGDVDAKSVFEPWQDALAKFLGLRYYEGPWTAAEMQRIESIASQRYASDLWTRRR